MERNKKKRSASKNIVQGLVIKIKENIADRDKRGEVETTMETIVIKMQSINALDETILNDIAEDELDGRYGDSDTIRN